jgi:protein ImuB
VPPRPLQVGGEATVWPGRVPDPAPTRVFDPAPPVDLLDPAGHPVVVSGRGELRHPPAVLRSELLPDGGGRVQGWCGPWIHDLCWWDPARRRRRALFQVVVAAGAGEVACLVAIERGRARLDAIY